MMFTDLPAVHEIYRRQYPKVELRLRELVTTGADCRAAGWNHRSGLSAGCGPPTDGISDQYLAGRALHRRTARCPPACRQTFATRHPFTQSALLLLCAAHGSNRFLKNHRVLRTTWIPPQHRPGRAPVANSRAPCSRRSWRLARPGLRRECGDTWRRLPRGSRSVSNHRGSRQTAAGSATTLAINFMEIARQRLAQ